MRFEFTLVDRSDDPAIRRLLADNPMPGRVAVAFEREPDYFIGHRVMGERCETLKAVDCETGNLAGVLCLASEARYVAGSVRPVGYLGQIRIESRYQGYLLPMRAAAFIRRTASVGWPDLWISAIVYDNPTALEIFAERPRPSFPHLEQVSEIHTLGMLTRPDSRGLRKHEGRRGRAQPVVVAGDRVGLEPIVRFLNGQGSRREFFPSFTTDYFSHAGRTPGFSLDDFLVATVDGDIVGVCGVWDQSDFKQVVVQGYRGWMQTMRPVVNALGPAIGMKRLPDIGEEIVSAYLSFVAVSEDDPHVFGTLLEAALASAYTVGVDYVMAGFSTRDPLLRIAKRFRHLLYQSTMYAFCFDRPPPSDAFNRGGIPYLEIATL